MPRELRSFVPGRHYFITNRTIEERMWLRPDQETNQACTRALAVALNKYPDVKLIAFVVMSNHFHLVLQADEYGSISDFVGIFQARLARQINARLDRRGPVWQRRFSAIPIVDDTALEDRITYTVLNPVRANLVTHIDKWPGLVSHRGDGRRRQFKFGASTVKASFRRTRSAFEEQSKTAIGARKLLAQDLNQRPKVPERTRAPLCHASNANSRRRYLEERKHFYLAYREAAAAYRRGEVAVSFPLGCFPPSRYPKLQCAA